MKSTTKNMVFIALCTTIMIICSFLTIPFIVPFTMQTFALFIIIGLLDIKNAFLSVLLYLLLGAIGLPVFSGFKGGIGILFGVTGGYLIGFLLTVLLSGYLLKILSKKVKLSLSTYIVSMFLGLIVCYTFGTLWYILLYTNSTESLSLTSVLSICVFPFILTDIVKIVLSFYVSKTLKKIMPKL